MKINDYCYPTERYCLVAVTEEGDNGIDAVNMFKKHTWLSRVTDDEPEDNVSYSIAHDLHNYYTIDCYVARAKSVKAFLKYGMGKGVPQWCISRQAGVMWVCFTLDL